MPFDGLFPSVPAQLHPKLSVSMVCSTRELKMPCLAAPPVVKPYRVTSPPPQFAEKKEAERQAKEEEEERQRREAEAAEEALRNKPKSKTEQVNELLRGKLEERLELCGELLVLLRRAQEKASVCTSRTRQLL